MAQGKRTRPPSQPSAPPPEAPAPKTLPERKFGPYRNGVGVAVWLNTIQTEDGPRKVRAITLSPRRYFDRERDEWRDSSSYRPYDLPVLLIALQQALEYVFTTPIPGGEPGDDTPF